MIWDTFFLSDTLEVQGSLFPDLGLGIDTGDTRKVGHTSMVHYAPSPPSQGFMLPKNHINIRILQDSISGIPLILGLRTRM